MNRAVNREGCDNDDDSKEGGCIEGVLILPGLIGFSRSLFCAGDLGQ